MGTEEIPIIQLYQPSSFHRPQTIVCNAAGRTLLKELLESGEQSAYAMTTDGEWFDLVVVETEEPEQYPIPYTREDGSTEEEWRALSKVVYTISDAAEQERRLTRQLRDEDPK